MPQMAIAAPWNANSTARVTTSLVATDALATSRRITSTSSSTPMVGAITNSVTASAIERRPALVDVQLPVHEREEHADGAVREVEDAGRDVADDQAGGRDGVDRAVADPDDQEDEELLHG